MLAIVAVGILGRVFQLQNIQGEKWRKLSDSLTTKLVNVAAIRGNIYSSDGSLLATSLPEYELRFDLMAEKVTDEIFNSKVDSLAYSLADLFKDKTAADYERKMIAARNHKDRYYLLKRNVTYLQLKKIRTFPIFRLGKNKGGLLFIQKNKRIQPFKSLAPRLIGYKIDVITDDQESVRRTAEFNQASSLFVEALDVEDMIANLLASEGFLSVEDLASAEISEIQSIEGFDEDLAKEIKKRAEEYLQKIS